MFACLFVINSFGFLKHNIKKESSENSSSIICYYHFEFKSNKFNIKQSYSFIKKPKKPYKTEAIIIPRNLIISMLIAESKTNNNNELI